MSLRDRTCNPTTRRSSPIFGSVNCGSKVEDLEGKRLNPTSLIAAGGKGRPPARRTRPVHRRKEGAPPAEDRVPGSAAASKHLQYVGARDARAKQAIAINLSDMGDFVADGRNLVDGRKDPLLRVGQIA